MKINRRQFVSIAGTTVAGFSLSSLVGRQAAAAVAPQRRFVFAYFEGGWDLLLGLDPRDPGTTSPTEDRIDPAYAQLAAMYQARGIQERRGMSFGPAVPASMLDHASDLAIVNGIDPGTAAHEVGRRYFITGKFPQGLNPVGSSAAAEIAARQGDVSAIPHLSAGVEAYAPGQPTYAAPFTVNSRDDLTVALTPFVQLPASVLAAVENFHDDGPGCNARRLDKTEVVTGLETNRLRARSYVDQNLGTYFDLQRTDAEMQALRDLYTIQGNTPADSPQVLSFLAGQALKFGISQCVSVRVARNLDTHSAWAATHAPALEAGFESLAALITDLKYTPLPEDDGRSIFDETTILAFSEFGRTPLLNDLDGRDHHLCNSCLLAGAGLQTGTTFGSSRSIGMLPIPVNLATGEIIERPTPEQEASGYARTLTPENILTTVFRSAGIEDDILRAEPISALLR